MEITKNSPRQQSCHTDSYTPVVTRSMRNRLRPQGIEAPRGAYGSGGWILEAGRWRRGKRGPPPPCFSQVLILKVFKVLCFDTLSQVLILNGLLAWRFASLDLYLKDLEGETDTARQFLERVRKVLMAEAMEAHCAQVERLGGAGFARSLRRTSRGANFMSYDSTEQAYCQEKYILGELLVRTDWQVIGGARVTVRTERDGMMLVADVGDT